MKRAICILLLFVFTATSAFAESFSDLFTVGVQEGAAEEAGLSVAINLLPAAAMEQMRQQDATYDLYLFALPTYGLSNLLDSGLAANLCENAALAKAADALPPALREEFMRDGQWMAFPVQLSLFYSQLITTKSKLAAYDLAAETMPATIMELLNRAIVWYRAGKLDGVRLLNAYHSSDEMVQFVLNEYVIAMTAHGGQPDYTDEVFKRLMEKALVLAAVMEEHQAFADGADCLFEVPVRMMEVTDDAETVALSLTLTDQHPAGQYLVGVVAVVNPYSTHKEEALSRLADEMEVLTDETRYYLTDASSMRTVSVGSEYVNRLASKGILPDLAAQMNGNQISIEQCIEMLQQQ